MTRRTKMQIEIAAHMFNVPLETMAAVTVLERKAKADRLRQKRPYFAWLRQRIAKTERQIEADLGLSPDLRVTITSPRIHR